MLLFGRPRPPDGEMPDDAVDDVVDDDDDEGVLMPLLCAPPAVPFWFSVVDILSLAVTPLPSYTGYYSAASLSFSFLRRWITTGTILGRGFINPSLNQNSVNARLRRWWARDTRIALAGKEIGRENASEGTRARARAKSEKEREKGRL